MQNTPRTPRTPPAKRQPSRRGTQHKPAKKRSIVFPLILLSAILALLVILMPKEPVPRAWATIGSIDEIIADASPQSGYAGLRISEVMSSNRAAVPDENGKFPDFVEIWNSSEIPIDLTHVGLSDRSDRIRFLFPAILLQPDERIIVFVSGTNNANPSKPLHAKFSLASVGETVFLYDPGAFLIDSVTLPIMNPDTVFALNTDGVFEVTDYYSPGYENTEEGYLAYRSETAVAEGAIVLNEVMADAKSNLLLDEDGELSDWIEFKSNLNEPYPLKNIFLSDNERKPLQWKFPDDAVIPANGYYVVFASGKDRGPNANGIPHTNFRISAEHDDVWLSDAQGRLLDRVTIDNLPADKTYGRDETGNWEIFNIGTPGLPNDAGGVAIADKMLRAKNPLGVYITEVVSSNDDIVISQGQRNTDAVELYNASNEVRYLEGYGLSDRVTRARRWQFPAGAAIPPGGYLVVHLDGKPELSVSGQYHTNFKLKRAGGETMCLSTPQGLVLDKIDLPLVPTNISYGRTAGLDGFFYYDAPTIGVANGTGFYGYTDTPSFTVRGGMYRETLEVGLNIPEGALVYYTRDGSIPTPNDTRYDGETIRVAFTGVLRARAFKDNLQPSDTITQTYFINTYHTLPIVAVSIDPDDLFGEVDGIFTPGPNVDKSKGIPFRNAIYREFGKTPRPGYVEYYSLNNEVIINQGLSVALSGANSLDIPQKSLKFRAKPLHGAKYIDSALFSDRPFTQYKSFVLRMGGNDGLWTRLVDGFQSQLVDELDTNVIHQAWTPVAVYINGIYWGHYNLRERKDRFFIAQHEGIPLSEASNMDIVKGSGRAQYGSSKEYNDLIKEARTLSPGKNQADLEYLTDRVDVVNLFDYMAIEMFVGNTDVGNMLIYKIKSEGSKFKWLLYDLDYGFFNSSVDSPKSYLKESGMGQDNVNNVIFRKLLESSEMKDLFLTRLGIVFKHFSTNHMIEKLDELIKLLEPEMPLHFARWSEFTDKAIIAEVPSNAEAGFRYWEQRTKVRLKNTLKKRPTLLYDMIQNQFKLSENEMVHYFGARPPMPPDVI